MGNRMNEAEALDRFLDDLIADPAATPPEEVDEATAMTMHAIVAAERPSVDADTLSQTQTRIWNRVLTEANSAQAPEKRTSLPRLWWRPRLAGLAVAATALLLVVML